MTKSIKGFAEQLSEKLLTEVGYGDIAILAGDLVMGPDAQYARNYGVYPDSSLEIASQIILEVRDRLEHEISMFTVVNDWKYLVGNPDSEEIRKSYWSNPTFDLRRSLNPELIPHLLPGRTTRTSLKADEERDITIGRYSEQKLHTDYSHFLRRGHNQEKIHQLFSEMGLTGAERCENQSCSLDKCASEIMMIMSRLYRSGIRKVITLLPAECAHPLEKGMEIFGEGRQIFLPEFTDPMHIDNHYLNCTGPQDEAELFDVNLPETHTTHLIK